MKFSKSYLQTMTDPAFPKEWREKGMEYKELKKLINGVVAELESLGLSADVLRDLLEPPETAKGSDDSTIPRKRAARRVNRSRSGSGSETESDGIDELAAGLVAGLARLTTGTGSPAPSDFVDPLSPLMKEEARCRSVEKSLTVSTMDSEDMPGPALHSAAGPDSHQQRSISPIGEWVAYLNHPEKSNGCRRARSRTRREHSKNASSADANTSSREVSLEPSKAGESARSDDFAKACLAADLRTKPGSMLDIGADRRSSSAESLSEKSSPSSANNWRMGRKGLEELRRNSHSGQARPSYSSEAKRKKRNSQSSEQEQGQTHDWTGHAWRERQGLGWDFPNDQKGKNNTAAPPAREQTCESSALVHRQQESRWVKGKGGRRARAEYELGGTPEHPIPRIRLTIESPVHSDDEDAPGGGRDDDDGCIKDLPTSRQASIEIAPNGAAANNTALYQYIPEQTPQQMRTRDIVIPLTADTQFLDTLTHSLKQLSELQASQKDEFITSTENLCASVARAASPYASKNDMYVWREIFQLWVEMQIFESLREKDRGELSVDESEMRLQRFAQELVKRGWLAELSSATSSSRLSRNQAAVERALTLPMKDWRSASAVEDFLRINLALLDVKKFQRINVEAARKILKKHDKRTALTASSGLRNLVRQQESSRAAAASAASFEMHVPELAASRGAESTGTLVAPAHGTHPSFAALLPSSTTGLLSESLPHILLSLLTTTLLPILPSVDDYSCAICTGLAWRPIRLDCGHLFCIRCLVKLQKREKENCPLCRAPNVVKTADGRNLDSATLNMLRMWFPNEICEKDAENESDRKREELSELGFEHHKCVAM